MMLSCGWIHSSGQTVSIKLPTLNLMIEKIEQAKVDSLIIIEKDKQLALKDSIISLKDSSFYVVHQGLTDMTTRYNTCGIDLQLANNKIENKNFMLKVLGGLLAIMTAGVVMK